MQKKNIKRLVGSKENTIYSVIEKVVEEIKSNYLKQKVKCEEEEREYG